MCADYPDCEVCHSPLRPTAALAGAYVHIDDRFEDHFPVLAQSDAETLRDAR